MNVSMYTNSRCDGLQVKVSTQQIRRLIKGEGPPRLTAWDCFRNFFLDLVCCACGGNRHASEQQLREIYLTLHPQLGEGVPQGEDIQSVMTTLEKLINLTDVTHQGDYHVCVSGPQNGMYQLTVSFGPHHLVDRTITATEKLFLEDHCLCVQDSVQGTYNLRLGMPSEGHRRVRFDEYDLVGKCISEGTCCGDMLHTKIPSSQLGKSGILPPKKQAQVLGAFPSLQALSQRLKNNDLKPKQGENGLQRQVQQAGHLQTSYQGYRGLCIKHNSKRVMDLLGGVYEHQLCMRTTGLEGCKAEMEDIFTHTQKYGLYGEEMTAGLIESTKCFMRKMCELAGISESHGFESSSEVCEELLEVLRPEGLGMITIEAEYELLMSWHECITKARENALELRGSALGTPAEAAGQQEDGQTMPEVGNQEAPTGATGQQEDGQTMPKVDKQEAPTGAAGRQEDGQTKSEAAGKKRGPRRWHDLGSIFVKKGKASKGKGPEKETSSLQKQQKELLDNTNKTKEAA